MIALLERCLGARSGVRGMVLAYAVSAALQGGAIALTVPVLQAALAGDAPSTRGWLLALAGCAAAVLVLQIITMMRANRVAVYGVTGRLSHQLGTKITRIALGWFDATSAGRAASALSDSVRTLSHLPSVVVPQLVTAVVTPITVALMLLAVDWRVGAALLLALPIGAACVWWSSRVLARVHRAEHEADAALAGRVLEFAALQPVLRAAGQASADDSATPGAAPGWIPLRDELHRHETTELRRLRAEGAPSAVFQLIVVASFAAALWLAVDAALAGRIDAAVFAAVGLLVVRCIEPMSLALNYVHELLNERSALDSVAEILDAPELEWPESGCDASADASAADAADGAAVGTAPAGLGIRMRGVEFGYGPGQRVLDGFDLDAPAGAVTAVVGPSGAGKTTVARLVARFWDVDAGSVEIGGRDVREYAEDELMRRIAFVFQDVHLFNTSLLENVRVGRADASDDEVFEAARRARLDEVVDRLPDRWDTRVGEGGSALSGGERQRVALARAFVKDAPVLLLDEVTSSLDTANEAAVSASIAELARDRTVLVIAHRPSTIERADRVVFLDEGRALETGAPHELLARGGRYARMLGAVADEHDDAAAAAADRDREDAR